MKHTCKDAETEFLNRGSWWLIYSSGINKYIIYTIGSGINKYTVYSISSGITNTYVQTIEAYVRKIKACVFCLHKMQYIIYKDILKS